MSDRLHRRRLKYFLRLEYPLHVTFTDDGVLGQYPDLPGCRAEAPSIDSLHEQIFDVRRRWIINRLERGEDVPLPNCHRSPPVES